MTQEQKLSRERKEKKVPHPLQPVYLDENGTARFKSNAIVRFLLDAGPFDMNKLAEMPFTDKEREHFAQLIGYSISGFGELSYVSDETYSAADKALTKLVKKSKAKKA
jgi:hypothetical protein